MGQRGIILREKLLGLGGEGIDVIWAADVAAHARSLEEAFAEEVGHLLSYGGGGHAHACLQGL